MPAVQMLTMEQAAAYLSVSYGTLRGRYKAWHIPFHKPGKRVMFREDDLDKWLQAQRRVV